MAQANTKNNRIRLQFPATPPEVDGDRIFFIGSSKFVCKNLLLPAIIFISLVQKVEQSIIRWLLGTHCGDANDTIVIGETVQVFGLVNPLSCVGGQFHLCIQLGRPVIAEQPSDSHL